MLCQFLSSAYIFQNNRFQNNLPGALSSCPEQDRGYVGPLIWSEQFAKVISRRQKSPLKRKVF